MKEKFKQWVKDNEENLNQLSKSFAEAGIKSEYVRLCIGVDGYIRVELDYETNTEAYRMHGEPFKIRFTEVLS